MAKYRVNKEKCVGCGVCVVNCPGATKIGDDGKAEIIGQEKLEQCGGENVCPMGAIEKVNGKPGSEQPHPQLEKQPQSQYPFPGRGRGIGRGQGGQGRGMGAGRGRGLGIGPRDGRGQGRGGRR